MPVQSVVWQDKSHAWAVSVIACSHAVILSACSCVRGCMTWHTQRTHHLQLMGALHTIKHFPSSPHSSSIPPSSKCPAPSSSCHHQSPPLPSLTYDVGTINQAHSQPSYSHLAALVYSTLTTPLLYSRRQNPLTLQPPTQTSTMPGYKVPRTRPLYYIDESAMSKGHSEYRTPVTPVEVSTPPPPSAPPIPPLTSTMA